MNRSKPLIISLIALLIIAATAAAYFVGQNKSSNKSQPSTATESNVTALDDATSGSKNEQGDVNVQPDINTEQFKITSSNVSCSTTSVNGVTTRNCSGNIHVVPTARAEMEPGLYKINENTKLLHNGVEEDLNNLQQLAQANQVVRLKLADASEDTLSQILY